MYRRWPCPAAAGGPHDELAFCIGAGAATLLILPPLFDEANKLRHQITATMRLLGAQKIACVLPDLPGCNESLAAHGGQTLASWRAAATAAAAHFDATHVLALRGGCWLAPDHLPGWLVAPPKPPSILRAMLRARTLASRERGEAETSEALLAVGRGDGLTLAGWDLSAALVRELETAAPMPGPAQRIVPQDDLGGAALWLRAEPDYDPAQAAALASLVTADLRQ